MGVVQRPRDERAQSAISHPESICLQTSSAPLAPMDLSSSALSSLGGTEQSLSFADLAGLHLSSFMPHAAAPGPARSPPPSLRIAMRIPEGTTVHSNVPFSVSGTVEERGRFGVGASLSVLHPTPLPPRAVAWMPPPLSPLYSLPSPSPSHSPMHAAANPSASAALRAPSRSAALSASQTSSSLSAPAMDAPPVSSSNSGGSATSSSASLQPLPLLPSSASLPTTAASSSPSPGVVAAPAADSSTAADATPRPVPVTVPVPVAAAASFNAMSSSPPSAAAPLSDPDLAEVLSRLEQSQSEFNLTLQSQTERRLREEARTDEGRERQAAERIDEQHSKESLSNMLRAQASARITERPWVAALRGEEIPVHRYGMNPVDGQPIYPSTIVESAERASRAKGEAREREEKQATASLAASASSSSAALSGPGRGLNALFVPSFVRAPAAPSNPRTLTVLERFGSLDPSAAAATAAAATAAAVPAVAPTFTPAPATLSSVSSSWPRGALSSASAVAVAPAAAAAPFASFSSSASTFVPAAFASPSPSQEVADLFRLSHQRRDRAAPRSRIIDEQVGLRVGGGGVVRPNVSSTAVEAPIAASGLQELWGRQGAARLAASLRQIEAMPSLAQVIANPAVVASQQQQGPFSTQQHSQPQPSLPASISTALSLATGTVVPTTTPEIERHYETLKREYLLELRARKQVEEEARCAQLHGEKEWREREEEEYQAVLQRTREERGLAQPGRIIQQQRQDPHLQQQRQQHQQQSASNEPPVRPQPASAARSASASPVPSVRSLRPAPLSRAASTLSNSARSLPQQQSQQTSLDSPHVAFSDSTAAPAADFAGAAAAAPIADFAGAADDDASAELIESHLDHLQCATKEAASTPVTVFVQQALDAIEAKLASKEAPRKHDAQERQRVAKELQELANLLASTTQTMQPKAGVKAAPVASSRSLPVSRRSSLHHSRTAGDGGAASSRALSSRALSSAVPSMRSSLQSSVQSSRAASIHGEEQEEQHEQTQPAEAEPQATRQIKPKARASLQPPQQQPQALLQTVSESSVRSRSSLPAGSTTDASSRRSFAPPTHARLASLASSTRGASIFGESQLVHPPHSRQSSLAHASAIEEMMDRTLPLDAEREPEQDRQLQRYPHEGDETSEHAGSVHASEHLSVSRAGSEHSSHTAPSTLKKAPPPPKPTRGPTAATGRLPLTAREVRALVRSRVLGSASELRANYSYLPPPLRPITLTRTQMLQQAAREVAARRAQEQSAHGTHCRLARRAAPIAAAVRRNVEAMLEQQMKLRGAQWDREAKQDLDAEGSQQQRKQREEEESKEQPLPPPQRSPNHRAALAQVDEMLRDPPRILQPTFSPPAMSKHRQTTSHSPARNYESTAALRNSPSQQQPPRSLSQGKSVMLSAVSPDFDVQAHLAGLFSTAKQQLQQQPQQHLDGSERSSRKSSVSVPAAAVAGSDSASAPPAGPSLSDLAADSSSSFVSSIPSSISDDSRSHDIDGEDAEEKIPSDAAAVHTNPTVDESITQWVASEMFKSAVRDISHSRHSSAASSAEHAASPRIELRPVAVILSSAERQ